MTINNVTIGDKFKQGKNTICKVIDFYEVKSMITGEVVGYKCIAVAVDSYAVNHFETPFSSVVRNRI